MTKYSLETLTQNVATGFGKVAWWHPLADTLGYPVMRYDGPVPTDVIERIIAEDIRSEMMLSASTLEPVSGHRRIYNATTDRTLQVASDGYAVHLPAVWCAEAALPLIDAAKGEGLGVSSVCSLGDGKYSSVTLSYPQTTTVADMDIAPYTSFSTGAGGDFASQINNGTVLMVCDNTIQIARGLGTVIKVRHSSDSAASYDKFVNAALDLHGYCALVVQRIEALALIPVSDKQWSDMLTAVLGPIPQDTERGRQNRLNKEDTLRNMYAFDSRCEPWRGTALGAFQTLNTWQQHVQRVDGVHRVERNIVNAITSKQADIDARFLHIISGVTDTQLVGAL